MFYQGTLQEGIAEALQLHKAVLCFVTNEEPESQRWENEYIADASIAWLQEASVALRLVAGSEEAKYLGAIVPLPKFPTIVILQNGALKEYMVSGLSKDQFIKRISAALGRSTSESTSPPQPSPSHAEVGQSNTLTSQQDAHTTVDSRSTEGTASALSTETTDLKADAADTSTGESKLQSTSETSRQDEPPSGANVSSVNLPTASQRSKLAKKETESPKPDSQSIEKKSQNSSTKTNDNKTPKATERDTFAEEIRRRKKEAEEDRRRILDKIKHDRLERQSKSTVAVSKPSSTSARLTGGQLNNTKIQRTDVAIQVRLPDGRSIRSRFPIHSTIRLDIRPWIDGQLTGGHGPYRLTVIRSPFPHKMIDDTEEDQDMETLELNPSATLVLTPVVHHSTAYTDSPSLLARIYNFIQWLILLLTASLFQKPSSPSNESLPASRPRDSQADRPVYNGNSLALDSSMPSEDESS